MSARAWIRRRNKAAWRAKHHSCPVIISWTSPQTLALWKAAPEGGPPPSAEFALTLEAYIRRVLETQKGPSPTPKGEDGP